MSKPNSVEYQRYFAEWIQLKGHLVLSFKVKNDARNELMEQGINLLTVIIDNATGITPINFSDRITFIKQNKNNYTAFRQLDELFKEMKKKIAVMLILKK
ncbi:hypothetical protein PB01_07760 [Psychrobacillus glaciei]|uniref:YpoC-like domain-containing protein n=1 Tax=Psychrobacillus glaciei TaxID=2283160 RepID=A0A5J6SLH5_9BACI|nr:hypothetical protein [Psychrobacillus glaciei]QFF98736.1 hypothetical protein PB01_07760 [Psychrobacillus glaciei]